MVCHFVQVGVLGAIGRFLPVDTTQFDRGDEVVCQTQRGLEIGAVVALDGRENWSVDEVDGRLLRKTGEQDQLLIERLKRNRKRALSACSEQIRRRGIETVLVDAEQLFDGRSLYFYFLGEVDQRLEELTEELADTYASKVRLKQLTDKLVNGCGPDCGTKDCGEAGACGSCAIAGGCRVKANR